MKITDDRTELDEVLEDPANIVLLLAGPKAAAIYDLASKGAQAWRKIVLVENLTQITPEENARWALANDRYVVLRKDRTVASRGSLNELCDQAGTPELRKINKALAEAE